MALQSQPQYTVEAFTNLGHLMDDIWYLAGDNSTDVSRDIFPIKNFPNILLDELVYEENLAGSYLWLCRHVTIVSSQRVYVLSINRTVHASR